METITDAVPCTAYGPGTAIHALCDDTYRTVCGQTSRRILSGADDHPIRVTCEPCLASLESRLAAVPAAGSGQIAVTMHQAGTRVPETESPSLATAFPWLHATFTVPVVGGDVQGARHRARGAAVRHVTSLGWAVGPSSMGNPSAITADGMMPQKWRNMSIAERSRCRGVLVQQSNNDRGEVAIWLSERPEPGWVEPGGHVDHVAHVAAAGLADGLADVLDEIIDRLTTIAERDAAVAPLMHETIEWLLHPDADTAERVRERRAKRLLGT